ncbi:MAG: class I SAM-dependent methyltransferase [Verrucomicrobia bacterium]|nr:class I SAM-dependent methyltransferase [Verrucomicrobiota bacterium]
MEITREFEHEKWGPVWQRVKDRSEPVTLSTVSSWIQVSTQQLEFCSQGSEFILLSNAEANQIWLELIEATIKPWLPAPALVELGCGYGNVLLFLANRFNHVVGQIFGGEYTKSGQALFRYLAKQENLAVQSGTCDIGAPGITALNLPNDSVIYTSYAVHYVPRLTTRFVEDLCSFRPRVVCHFEPCYEHANEDSLIGLMRRRYMEINDYNRNLVTILEAAEKDGRIQIITQEPNLFGMNALLPASLIAWKPAINN